jgi:AraC-like DNA-binding protein
MLSSETGTFTEPDDFEAALRDDGCISYVVTQQGPFRAQLTRIALNRLRLQSTNESSARVAFLAVPAESVLLSIPIGRHLPAHWGGTSPSPGEVITVGPSHRTHTRSATGGRWGTLLLPLRILDSHSRALTGVPLVPPAGVARWRPGVKANRELIRLHMSATGIANVRAGVLTRSEAARGLEAELLDAVVTCLSGQHEEWPRRAQAGHAEIMARFEDLLREQPKRAWTVAALSESLVLSGSLLRTCCDEHLGMGPIAYLRLRRMQLVRRALREADVNFNSVAEVAALYGFRAAGRFAGAYRANFGELPSATLRRDASR